MKAIYMICLFCLVNFCAAQTTTPERQALWKEYMEIIDLMNIEDYDTAIIVLDNFIKKDLSIYPDIRVNALMAKVFYQLDLNPPDSTDQSIDEVELFINRHGLDSLKPKLYRLKGQAYLRKSNFNSAIRVQLKGLNAAENFGIEIMEMGLSYDIGCSYGYLSRTDSARYYIKRALNIATKNNDHHWIANTIGVLSSIEKTDGNLIKSMEYAFEAYESAKIFKGNTDNTKAEYVANHLFDIYYNLGNDDSALEMVNFTIEQKRAAGFYFMDEAYLMIKSALLLRMDSLESCGILLDELEESYQISKKLQYSKQVVALKGGLLYKRKQWNAAEEELSKLLSAIDTVSLQWPIIKIVSQGLHYLAKLKLRRQDYITSISICEEQLKKKEIGYHYRKEFLGTLAACHQALGNYSTAYDYLLQRDAVRDTIDRFYDGSLRLSKEQEMLDQEQELLNQQKADEIENLKHQNELSQIKTAQQRNLIIIGSILTLLVSGILYLWGRQRKLVFENTLVDVKQQLLRQQINPHFIFNVLNSIQNSVLTLKKEKSIELISKFSKLMRQILQNSDKEKVSIHEEISLLTNYMDLEKMRTKKKFDYEVLIDESIDIYNEEIPSMILQLFVENAIWHGILPKEERGLIKVKVEKEKDRIKVIIDDDGVGRKMSAKLKTKDQQEKVSMGMKLIKQRIQTLNKKYQSNIDMFIGDGTDGKGTEALLIT